MDYYYWILGAILVALLIYYFYFFILHKPRIINLNSTTSNIIPDDEIDNSVSQIYSYSLWVYAKKINNETNKNDGKTNIFYYGPNIRLDITNNLHLDFSNNIITEYFPMEQWVYVVICANTNKETTIYDFYLDGKLVKTIQPLTSLPIPNIREIQIGYNPQGAVVDIRLANFKRLSKAYTHYEVEVEYEKNKSIKDYYKSPKYNLEISVKNGKTDQKNYSLFTRYQTTLERATKNSFNNST
jgi:hypothetical protein